MLDKVLEGKFAMLAHKSDREKIVFDAPKTYNFVQPKLDGVRCIITKDGAFSRNGKEFMNVEHIKDELAPLFRYAPELILDGELYNHDFKDNFNKIISLVRKTVNITEEMRNDAKVIEFHCYDVVDVKRPELTYRERHDIIQHLIYKYKLKYLKEVATFVVDSWDEVQKRHEECKHRGYEGSMIRSNTPYQNTRTYALQKVKDWHDSEFTITGFIEGKGKFANGLGKFLGVDEDGREVEVPWPNLKLYARKTVWENRDYYIGKVATFEWFERTPGGAYRFPRLKAFRNYE